jgi:hypothetical protein
MCLSNATCAATARGWVNVCTFLDDHNNVPFYHRGYPMSERWRKDESAASVGAVTARVAVNAAGPCTSGNTVYP